MKKIIDIFAFQIVYLGKDSERKFGHTHNRKGNLKIFLKRRAAERNAEKRHLVAVPFHKTWGILQENLKSGMFPNSLHSHSYFWTINMSSVHHFLLKRTSLFPEHIKYDGVSLPFQKIPSFNQFCTSQSVRIKFFSKCFFCNPLVFIILFCVRILRLQ